MKILTKNGKALQSDGGVLASVPPYYYLWGYHQAQNDVTTEPHDWAAVYAWIYQCCNEGLSAGQRTISVDGTSYFFPSDGGEAYVGGSLYKDGFRRIIIPLIQFGITNNATNRSEVSRTITGVLRDNHTFSYYNCGFEVNQVGGSAASWQQAYGNYVGYVNIIVPSDELRAFAQLCIERAVAAIKTIVKAVTGYTTSIARNWTSADWAKRRDVVKVIHDWIMDNIHYRTEEEREASIYWNRVAASVFNIGPDISPVCAAYSAALAMLCNLYSIPALYVSGGIGGATSGHAWNLLSFVLPMGNFDTDASKWAAIDITYDDAYFDANTFSAYKTYAVGKKRLYEDGYWQCHTPINVPGPWTGDANWTYLVPAFDIVNRPWSCFATEEMYSRDDRTQLRGYPVNAPGAFYPYFGYAPSGMYDITKWTAPSGT